MSDRPIQVNDLVMVLRGSGCKCPQPSLGKIFRVAAIWTNTLHCPYCRMTTDASPVPMASNHPRSVNDCGFQLYRLKRIDPLSELESTETREELHA